jgi:alpha-glucosidase
MKKHLLAIALLCSTLALSAKTHTLHSPDKQISVAVNIGDVISYSVYHNNAQLVSPSRLAMQLTDGTNWGTDARLQRTRTSSHDFTFPTPIHFTESVRNHYNELTLQFRGNWGLRFRAYNDGIAYRFFYTGKKAINIENELVELLFPEDHHTYTPYVYNISGGEKETFERQFFNSFENTYEHLKISELDSDKLIFLPMLIEAPNGIKMCFTEADLESYPGLFLNKPTDAEKVVGVFAPYPAETRDGGYNNLQRVVVKHENFIAKVNGAREFPWRTAIITTNDKDLATNDMVIRLASPNRIGDTSWIKPGKVAWDWWNNWNIFGVDFEAGINNQTYKYYIDFASEQGIEYVILDEGWAVNKLADLMQVVPEIDVKELVDYGKERNVGIILWAGYKAFDEDMENVCRHYAEMGVKGFKIDFMNRDDQLLVDFIYRASETTARYKMLANFHGMYKPTGLQYTYPNAINFEGVYGLEQMKWAPTTVDLVTYDVTVPFIRMVAGPIDYTQGAMKNAARGMYRPVYSDPMSQGTRCRQLALYVIFNSPMNMLCDSPSEYKKEPESTKFIAEIPVVWDESIALDGKVAEHISMARRSGDEWYVGGLTNWSRRNAEVKLDFLKPGVKYTLTLYKDGINAHRKGIDHVIEVLEVTSETRLTIPMAPGGGFAARIAPASAR